MPENNGKRGCRYEEISLSSLSISDYTSLEPLCDKLLNWTDDNMVSLSLPSLRVDSFNKDLMRRIESVRSSSLTFAPEAGTQRLRDVINKGVTEADLIEKVRDAFEGGWSSVKLYFMMGLPTETYDDLDGIMGDTFDVADLHIDFSRRLITLSGTEIRLTQTEYNIVTVLAHHAGRVMTYAAIIRAVWGTTDDGSVKKLQVNMANIRKKLGERPGERRYISNELGVGYRMMSDE